MIERDWLNMMNCKQAEDQLNSMEFSLCITLSCPYNRRVKSEESQVFAQERDKGQLEEAFVSMEECKGHPGCQSAPPFENRTFCVPYSNPGRFFHPQELFDVSVKTEYDRLKEFFQMSPIFTEAFTTSIAPLPRSSILPRATTCSLTYSIKWSHRTRENAKVEEE